MKGISLVALEELCKARFMELKASLFEHLDDILPVREVIRRQDIMKVLKGTVKDLRTMAIKRTAEAEGEDISMLPHPRFLSRAFVLGKLDAEIKKAHIMRASGKYSAHTGDNAIEGLMLIKTFVLEMEEVEIPPLTAEVMMELLEEVMK